MASTTTLAKTLTTSRGHRVHTSTVTHLLVRRVFRTGHTLAATDGFLTIDLATFADAATAEAEARRLAASTGLALGEPTGGLGATLPESRYSPAAAGGYRVVQPPLPLG